MDLDDEELEATKKIKEKTADEMFEDLEYEKTISNIDDVEEIYYINSKIDIDICFCLNTQEIVINEYEPKYHGIVFDTQELQAINKKVEELGWIKKN